jgi:MSHA pilin protein MshA
MKTARAAHRGFTLIELIVVVSIIGILVAIAWPRYIEMQRDARSAKAKGIFGTIQSASVLAHSRCLLDLSGVAPSLTQYNCATNPPMVDMEGTMIRIANRYPAATQDGIDIAAQLTAASNDLIIGMDNSSGVTTRVFDMVGGTVPLCRVSYQEATLNGGVFVAPVISVVTDGC